MNGESVTGFELHARVTCVAQQLQCRFVAPKDRILITMQPCIDFYATAIAALAIGQPPTLALSRPQSPPTLSQAAASWCSIPPWATSAATTALPRQSPPSGCGRVQSSNTSRCLVQLWRPFTSTLSPSHPPAASSETLTPSMPPPTLPPVHPPFVSLHQDPAPPYLPPPFPLPPSPRAAVAIRLCSC